MGGHYGLILQKNKNIVILINYAKLLLMGLNCLNLDKKKNKEKYISNQINFPEQCNLFHIFIYRQKTVRSVFTEVSHVCVHFIVIFISMKIQLHVILNKFLQALKTK